MTATAFDSPGWQREWLELASRGAVLAQTLATLAPEPAGAARDAVWAHGKSTLYRYRACTESSSRRPLLVVFAMVNRPDVLDLQPDRSLIRGLLGKGIDVYLIDWGRADRADRKLGLDHYLGQCMDGAVAHMLAANPGVRAVDVLGVCQGGTLALCYTALHARHVANLVTMITPVDFKTPDNLLSKWAQGLDVDLIASAGNVPGELLNALFVALKPFRLTQQKYFHLLAKPHDRAQLETFMRLERWIFDSPEQPAEVFRQFVRDLYQQNQLMRGEFVIGGQRVDLRRIRQPVLNVFASRDHLVPPSASRPLGQLIASRDYTALEIDTGHIGIYVSRAAQTLSARVAAWLAEREAARKPSRAKRKRG